MGKENLKCKVQILNKIEEIGLMKWHGISKGIFKFSLDHTVYCIIYVDVEVRTLDTPVIHLKVNF